jgi:5-oxopent-3-ene-1,2,5-tricarboxylate decarboxylase/2-hydroxyhepta-2,4-diene-1,7-dioate isomerase
MLAIASGMAILDPRLDFAPWRLSGTVIGPLLNDPAALAALGAAVDAPPYRAPPRAPVLYVKPRNTLAGSGAEIGAPADGGEYELGATLGLVIGRTACRVAAVHALQHVAGLAIVVDLSVPHASFYRPGVRFKARDGSCIVGAAVARGALDPDAAVLQVAVDGRPVAAAPMAGLQRPAARLIEDVSEFMTLHPGDLLLLGVRHGAPRVRGGQRFAVAAEGLAGVEAALAAGGAA